VSNEEADVGGEVVREGLFPGTEAAELEASDGGRRALWSLVPVLRTSSLAIFTVVWRVAKVQSAMDVLRCWW
jgi:hypothetical protein